MFIFRVHNKHEYRVQGWAFVWRGKYETGNIFLHILQRFIPLGNLFFRKPGFANGFGMEKKKSAKLVGTAVWKLGQ